MVAKKLTHEEMLDRFTARIVFTDTCWLWKGNKNRNGYGMFTTAWNMGYEAFAHRIMWEEYYGFIPRSYTIDHMCGQKGCVNPKHLQLMARSHHAKQGQRLGAQAKRDNPQQYCLRGHPRVPENLTKSGGCRECRRMRDRGDL
jgi:hypothetical protein